MQPALSPDGKTIAFISDRKGKTTSGSWTPTAEDPRAVFTDKTQRALSPVWSPDGNYIIVQRQGTRQESGPEFAWTLVMYHKDGGSGIELVGKDKGPGWHSVYVMENISTSTYRSARHFLLAIPIQCSAARQLSPHEFANAQD
jgi:Tol biopolymer transport system component